MPKANAAIVLVLSNSWSPTNKVTIWTVTVVTASKGFIVILADNPAAMTTIIVSPIALDIANKKGTPVLASSDGIIVLAEKDLYFSGGTIIMSHGQGLTSSFLHLSAISVKVGDKVIQGQVIGSMGATGRATGSHLDWRMEIRGVRIDPRLLLK